MSEVPTITTERKPWGIKYVASSQEHGSWGPYLREGKGYTVEEAIAKWKRWGHHGKKGASDVNRPMG